MKIQCENEVLLVSYLLVPRVDIITYSGSSAMKYVGASLALISAFVLFTSYSLTYVHYEFMSGRFASANALLLLIPFAGAILLGGYALASVLAKSVEHHEPTTTRFRTTSSSELHGAYRGLSDRMIHQ